jgi:hypothetical protein
MTRREIEDARAHLKAWFPNQSVERHTFNKLCDQAVRSLKNAAPQAPCESPPLDRDTAQPTENPATALVSATKEQAYQHAASAIGIVLTRGGFSDDCIRWTVEKLAEFRDAPPPEERRTVRLACDDKSKCSDPDQCEEAGECLYAMGVLPRPL